MFAKVFLGVKLFISHYLIGKIKAEIGMDKITCRKRYPTEACSPKFNGLPKVHKKDIPFRPIVSSRGSVTFGIAKKLVSILISLVGQSTHNVHNTQEFMEYIKNVKFNIGECITS